MGIAWIRGFRTKKDEMTSNVLMQGCDLRNCDRVASVLTNSRIIAMFDNFAHRCCLPKKSKKRFDLQN